MPKMIVTMANNSNMMKKINVKLNVRKKPIAAMIIDMRKLRIVKGMK